MLDLFRLATLGVVLSCAGCAHHSMPPADGPTVEVLVKGTPASLLAFDKALQPTLAGHAVGCVRCDQLGTTTPPATVTYSFFSNQGAIYSKFGAAWNAVPTTPSDAKPEMTFFRAIATPPDCTTKPACYDLYPCLQYNHCTTDATKRSCKGPCL